MNNNVIPLNARQNAETGAKGDRVTAVVPSTRPSATPAVYTIAEVAEVLAISPGTAYAWVRSGQIPAKRVGGRWLISRRRLQMWIDDLPEASIEDVARKLGIEASAPSSPDGDS